MTFSQFLYNIISTINTIHVVKYMILSKNSIYLYLLYWKCHDVIVIYITL